MSSYWVKMEKTVPVPGCRTKRCLVRLASGGVVESRFQSLVLVEGALSTIGNGPTILISVNDDGVLHWPHSAQ
jgi:hypothetical protein